MKTTHPQSERERVDRATRIVAPTLALMFVAFIIALFLAPSGQM